MEKKIDFEKVCITYEGFQRGLRMLTPPQGIFCGRYNMLSAPE